MIMQGAVYLETCTHGSEEGKTCKGLPSPLFMVGSPDLAGEPKTCLTGTSYLFLCRKYHAPIPTTEVAPQLTLPQLTFSRCSPVPIQVLIFAAWSQRYFAGSHFCSPRLLPFWES